MQRPAAQLAAIGVGMVSSPIWLLASADSTYMVFFGLLSLPFLLLPVGGAALLTPKICETLGAPTWLGYPIIATGLAAVAPVSLATVIPLVRDFHTPLQSIADGWTQAFPIIKLCAGTGLTAGLTLLTLEIRRTER